MFYFFEWLVGEGKTTPFSRVIPTVIPVNVFAGENN